MARAGGGARDVLYGRVPEDALAQAAGARYFAMDAREDVGEAPAARRPAPLLEVLPQDPVLDVPMLQMVVPQMVEQLVDFHTPLDFPVPEQVIEVPKIVCPPRAARTVLCAPQTVEQLLEAPTIMSLIEGSPLTFQFLMVAHTSKILVSHRFLKKLLEKRFKWFLALFPGEKSARLGPHAGSELSADFTPWTPAAYAESMAVDDYESEAPSTPPAQQQSTSPSMEWETWVNGDDVWIRVDSLQGPCWKKLLSDHWQWYPPWLGH